MTRASAVMRFAGLGFAPLFLSLAAGIANAQTGLPREAPATLTAVDFNFVGQAIWALPSRWIPAGSLKRRAEAPAFAITPT